MIRVILLLFTIFISVISAEFENIDYIIGIDLGTNTSCACVYKKGRVEVITKIENNEVLSDNEQDKLTPEYV